MPRKVLVTGAAGFIGSHVVRALLARGDEVIGLDSFDPFYARELKVENVRFSGRGSEDRLTLVEGDICDAETLRRVFREHRPVSVIHLAAKAGVRPSLVDPASYMHVNVTGTARVLQESHRASVERVVIASSSSVYGNARAVPFREDSENLRPISPYGVSKRACELLADAHARMTGQPVGLLRFFTVYGPRQRPDLAIAGFLKNVSEGREIRMFGDGSSARDYTYVDDIVRGVLRAEERIDRHGYRIWNLGGSSPISLAEMIRVIELVVGKRAIIRREATQPGDVERTYADLTRSESELGYMPTTPFEEGVRRQWRCACDQSAG